MTWSLPWRRPSGQGRPLAYILALVSALLAASALALENKNGFNGNPRIVEHPTDHYVAEDEPAKLLCKAEGQPRPDITWYRDGRKVITNQVDNTAHILSLNGGTELFFLRIIHQPGGPSDLGTYYCNATNIHGTAISRNATFKLAVLHGTFRQDPEGDTVAVGEMVVFHCKPPRGEPDPKIMWLKDGTAVPLSDRSSVSDAGDLTITNVRSTDAGEYRCLAINQGGEKESHPAQLTVQEKPTFREMPDDIVAREKDTVELKCKASGDPTPKIQWRREKGRIPYGRARQLNDGTLRIEKVEVVDNGKYVCEAHNMAGFVEAVGKLNVQTEPTFLVRPSNLSVAKGRTATLQCVVTGNPPPTVFWSTGNEQNLMFANSDNGRFNVSSDGTLRIESVEFSDGTEYTCQALSALGSNNARATLTVVEHDSRPPPIISQGPQNQTLEPQELALLTCKAEGTPPPTVRWYHDGAPLIYTDPRLTFLNSGTLQISDVQYEDSGQYMCKAISETGETDWSAHLTVAAQGPYQKGAKVSAMPGAPSRPLTSDITDTSVHVDWTPSSQNGQSPVAAYLVDFFSPETPQGWERATESVTRSQFTVRNLQPETNYLFVVRAKNAAGVSPPSPMSEYIRTREKRTNFAVHLPREDVEKKLGAIRIEMKVAEPINTSALRAKWEVSQGSMTAIEGYYINYTEVMTRDDPVTLGPSLKVKVADPYEYAGQVGGLKVFTTYQVCVAAYAQDVTSPCSQTMRVRTQESVPSAPPTNIVVHKDGSTLRVRWSPPELDYQNGDITGYDIECVSVDSAPHAPPPNCSQRVSGQSGQVSLKHVHEGHTYKIRIAARTALGRGQWSNFVSMGPEESTIMSEPWFVWLVLGTIVVGVWAALCVFSIFMCRKKRRNKKKMVQNGMYSAVPVHKSEESGRGGAVVSREDALYAQKEGNVHGYGGLQSDLASLLDCGAGHKDVCGGPEASGHPQMKTFYQKPGTVDRSQSVSSSVAPYATTTLINKGGNPAMARPSQTSAPTESGFRPINHAYVHSSASGSGDSSSCQKGEVRSSDTDNSRPTTAAGCPHDHCEPLTSPGSDSGSLTTDENGVPVKRAAHKYSKIGPPSQCSNCGKQPMVNWAELLPPPPEHPPPHEMGVAAPPRHPGSSSAASSSTTTTTNSTNNMAETRFINNRSPISPVSKISACSCPLPHDRMLVGGSNPGGGVRGGCGGGCVAVPSYSDVEYPTHPGPAHLRYRGDGGVLSYPGDPPQLGKPVGLLRGQTDALLHRCQSPVSCHNCGSNLGQQPPPLPPPHPSSSSSNSSSYGVSAAGVGGHHAGVGGVLDSNSALTLSQGAAGNSYPMADMYPALSQAPGHPSHGLSSGGGYPPYPPAALHGYRLTGLDPGDHRNSGDLDGLAQGHVYTSVGGATAEVGVDRACQSSLPSLAAECLPQTFGRRRESQECPQDYGVVESDVDVVRDCHSPGSSLNGEGSISGSMQAGGWPSSPTEDSSDDLLSHDGTEDNLRGHNDLDLDPATSDSSGSSSFLADTDFASAVARAAELSGLTVVGTTVSAEPKPGGKKYRKHRTTPPSARPTSPYSTDSNMSAVVHKPYPKSERKKQLLEQAKKYGQRKDAAAMQEMEMEETDPHSMKS